MGLERGEAAAFFCTRPGDEALLAGRRQLLAEHRAFQKPGQPVSRFSRMAMTAA